jgi:hypothetical protein
MSDLFTSKPPSLTDLYYGTCFLSGSLRNKSANKCKSPAPDVENSGAKEQEFPTELEAGTYSFRSTGENWISSDNFALQYKSSICKVDRYPVAGRVKMERLDVPWCF